MATASLAKGLSTTCKMTVNIKAANEPFLKHLNVQKSPHVIVTAEDDDFDETTLQKLQGEGFHVQYVAMGEGGGAAYAQRLHDVAGRMTGVSEYYAIVAYGDAASTVLETHTNGSPRLCAIIAYYPSTIPDPSRTSYPLNTSVLMHLAGGDIGIRRNQEVLGIQGKRKTVRKRIARGVGVGGEMKLGCPSYKYEGVEPGFAENDLEDHDPIADDLAWSRTLRVLRESFGMKVDIENLRDQNAENVRSGHFHKALNATSVHAKVLFTPTMTGAISSNNLNRFYSEFFSPSPADLNARLTSRTIGVDRVVDEINLTFQHDQEIPWLLPGIPPTQKDVDIMIVSIVCIKAGLLSSEHVYWDQASVLMQIGLIDPKDVPKHLKDKGVEILPIVGAESARALKGHKEEINELIDAW